MPSPRVSLIVPFFNVESYVGECLGSIGRQTMADFEVVLVDDGSTDGSRAIAEGYCGRDPRFQLHVQSNRGLAAARNAGVAEASGEYVMFVDSDDLIPPRALELFVSRLDSTGSSMAVGNARRFDLAVTEPSWGQLRSAASDRDRTTLTSFPALAADRIACNKMFRRSFWTQHDYAFPEIRYEDYPVVLAALLDAPAIDCVSAPVYFWRRRESGASITQRSHDVDNAFDRLASAQLVLDLAEQRASDSVEREVHNLLARIDLPAVLAAFADADRQETPKLAREVASLAERLQTPAAHPKSGFLALQLHALDTSNHQMLQDLARHRQRIDESHESTRVSRTRPWRREFVLPGSTIRPRPAPARTYLVPYWRHRLSTSVDSIRINGGELSVRGTAAIEFITRRPVVTVRAKSGDRTVRGRVTRDVDGEFFDARFDLCDLAVADIEKWEIVVEARHGWLHRAGALVHPESATRPSSTVVDDGEERWWRVGVDGGGAVVVDVLRRPSVAREVSIVGSTVRVGLVQPCAAAVFALRRDDGSVIPLDSEGRDSRGHVEIDLIPLLGDRPADNPATGVASYELLEFDGGRPVFAGPLVRPQRWTSGRWMIVVTRSPGGAIVIERSELVPTVDAVEVTDARLVLIGGGDSPSGLEWRAGADAPAAPAELDVVGRRWRAAVGIDRLASMLGSTGQRSALATADGRAVRLDGFAAASLPTYVPVPGGRSGSGCAARRSTPRAVETRAGGDRPGTSEAAPSNVRTRHRWLRTSRWPSGGSGSGCDEPSARGGHPPVRPGSRCRRSPTWIGRRTWSGIASVGAASDCRWSRSASGTTGIASRSCAPRRPIPREPVTSRLTTPDETRARPPLGYRALSLAGSHRTGFSDAAHCHLRRRDLGLQNGDHP
jgi:hypothetical protein